MPIEQGQKVRLILNMSFPKGESFNDFVEEDIRKVYMSSAKQFGQLVREVGKGAFMSKMDMRDAYKTIPARPEDFGLKGFKWSGAFLIETQMIFGSATSPANFDNVAKTIEEIAAKKSQTWRNRTLDYTCIIAPSESGICETFSKN